MNKGFSLLEISVVLAVVALLAGGVLTGKSILRNSELKSVSSDLLRYKAAVDSFRDIYDALPGDMPDATEIWGAQHSTPTTCRTTASVSALTCNGNGDRRVESLDGGTTYSERHRFWQHLANAKLIDGRFSGVGGPSGVSSIVPGVNSPLSRMKSATFSNDYISTIMILNVFDDQSTNTIWFGYPGYLPALYPSEMHGIDKKLDDGRPGSGNIISVRPTYRPKCATTNDPVTAEYDIGVTSKTCVLRMYDAFR